MTGPDDTDLLAAFDVDLVYERRLTARAGVVDVSALTTGTRPSSLGGDGR